MRTYFYELLAKYIGLYVRPEDSLVEIDPPSDGLLNHFPRTTILCSENLEQSELLASTDYVLLNGSLHYQGDIQTFLDKLHAQMPPGARLITIYYSNLWKPALRLATAMGMRRKTLEANWLDHDDISNLLKLTDFEPIRLDSKVLLPLPIPFFSNFVNRYLAPLPFFRMFTILNILVARPIRADETLSSPSVSVVVPARNEAGNIENIVRRTPMMGANDEIIFVEGGSSDDTWDRIRAIQADYAGKRSIQIAQQTGKGKGDAVRKGFSLASNEVFMILDADLTVPPEDLPKFYEAIVSGKAEFVNGSRLVYPMERSAMRFLNLLANKFFAVAFTFVLGQHFKDTLCGTKAITRNDYAKLAAHRAFFGEFDPFGDFDLIFGVSRLGLKIAEIPITYRERTYGDTNISRWRHGTMLLAMLVFASKRLKFV